MKIQKKKGFILLIFTAILVVCFNPLSGFGQQSETAENDSRERALKIIDDAKKAVNAKALSISSLNLKLDESKTNIFTPAGQVNAQRTSKSNCIVIYDLLILRMAKTQNRCQMEDGVGVDNYVVMEDNYISQNYSIVDGKRQDGSLLLDDDRKKEQLQNLKIASFLRVFPVLFEVPFDVDIEFRYLGKAEISGIVAEGIEANLSNRSKMQLYLDADSHLPILQIYNGSTKYGAVFTNKTMYFRYKVFNGIFIATTTKIENISETKAGKFETIQENSLKSVRINPEYNPKDFQF